MLEYKVVTANNTDALENAVADLIDMGFQPAGGVAVFHDGRFATWSQAMVRAGEPTVLQMPPAVVVGCAMDDGLGFDLERE